MTDPGHGALVISLDFELHWGVFDIYGPESSYTANLLGAREVVPRMLALFEEFDIAATWATVGCLFATSREHLEARKPSIRPCHTDSRLDPYLVRVGDGETEDPLHYAAGLIRQVMATPRQEVATHTFGHIYCEEPGQTPETVRADLESAVAIAGDYGLDIRSIVFPRNQVNPAYFPILKELGITTYRGRDPHWMYDESNAVSFHRPPMRLARLADLYAPLSTYNLTAWDAVVRPDGLCNVAATQFLPHWRTLTRRRMRWTRSAIGAAARKRRIVHLWWHPHDFGAEPEQNLTRLRAVLEAAARYRDSHGLRSMTMSEVAQTAVSLRQR